MMQWPFESMTFFHETNTFVMHSAKRMQSKRIKTIFVLTCIVMQEASDAHSKTADSDTVSTYQVSSVLTDHPPSGSSIDPASVAV